MARLTSYDKENGFILVKEEERLLSAKEFINKDEMYKIMRHLAEKLYEYEQLEEQGLLLKLPCSIGTEVWTIMCGMTGKHPTLFKQSFEYSMIEHFGKAVFLTKEEAQQKMNEISQ